ncbi:MAG: DNA repair protein RadA, partial [Rhodobacteraceae bacterium]|nr:DNA repair protein RadA [Paracoccaceae bacterium]MCB2157878.1 DNA repair protein RadA [Paracoccaceae bacterium]
MAKAQTSFTCTACGAVHRKWAGRCDACGAWNSIAEEAPLSAGPGARALGAVRGRTVDLTTLATTEAPLPRRESGLSEFDRVL